ncbi:DUF2170 family protein [uncultured Tateyamaria sp.]|uniref:DUF2170 family protein n=1 Tax=uncultured Tateyamaria sp. TaxID=455651 RepID=UPI00262DA896|nr:DUF2170 family protein [uncultured Tateyamaria sp.]
MTESEVSWTTRSLADALIRLDQGKGFSINHIEDTDVLEVSVATAGDFVLHVAVGAAQILTSAILWPRDAQDDPEAFESMMLRNHKALLPLCALSIDKVDGREFYELFGAVSRNASLDEIVEEFSVIAESALELASDIGPRTGKESAA